MLLSQIRRLTLSMICALPLTSVAAPSTEAPTTVEPNAANDLPLAAAARTGERNSDTRTIDLLVEMQKPSAGIQFNERAGRNPAREGVARTPQPTQAVQGPQIEAPPTPPSGLFGSGATPAVQARTQNIVERSSVSDGMPSRASGRPSSDLPPEVKRWLQGPREVIEYVRENRGFVIGCTAVLLLLAWAGSMIFSRSRG